MSGADFRAFDVGLDGRNVVTASAGTGKTYAITALVVRLVVEKGFDLRKVLVVTFTEAATAELRGRIRERLRQAERAYRRMDRGGCGDDALDAYVQRRRASRDADLARIQLALDNVDEAPISTIHGFCYRMLHDSAFETDVEYEAELLTDTSALRDEVLYDAWATLVTDLPEGAIERIRAAGITPTTLRGLVDKVTRSPDLAVLSDETAAIAGELVATARDVWVGRRADLETAFEATFEKLPKQRKTLVGWFDQVDGFLRAGELGPGSKLPVGVRNFASSRLLQGRGPLPAFVNVVRRIRAFAETGAQRFDPDVIALERALVEYVRREIPARKHDRGLLSFDDMLVLLQRALSGPNRERMAEIIRGKFQAALVDEFQDTDPVQFSIFDAVYARTTQPLFLIGDPKQAIYSFRGADVFAFLRAVTRPGATVHTMGTNWRSDPRLIDAVNAIFEERPGWKTPFLTDRIGYRPVRPRPDAEDRFHAAGPFEGGALEFLFQRRLPGEDSIGKGGAKDDLPDIVAADVSALLRSDCRVGDAPIQPGDVAILTRTNKQCFAIQDALRQLGIPAVVMGDRSVFESPEATELGRVLAAIVEPSRFEMRKALVTELLGVSANALARMEVDPGGWDRWVLSFRTWSQTWAEKGFIQAFEAMMTDAGVTERLLTLADGQRRMTNLLHVAELLHAAARESHLGPMALLHWFADQRRHPQHQVEHSEIRLESDDAAVKLTTIHKSKGLEYPVVYCPYLWDGWLLHRDDAAAVRFHDPDEDFVLKLDLGSAAFYSHLEQAELEALAENLRLLYVALTRAKHRCVVVWGGFNDIQTSALFTLLHPPDVAPGETLAMRHFKGRGLPSDDDLLAAIRDRAEASRGAIGVRDMEPRAPGVAFPPRDGEARALAVRQAARGVRGGWRMTSFSALTSGGVSAPEEAEGKDHDEITEATEATAVDLPARAGEPIVLHAFPRGAKAGVFYHALLEHHDFREPSGLEQLVRESLERLRYAADEWTAPVVQSVTDVLATPLTGGGMCLGDIPRDRRLDELEFHLPVADGVLEGESAVPTMTQKGLALVFREHPSDAVPAGYAESLGRLRFMPVRGFLKGYVDLVFEREGRFYLVDYKTNFLGGHLEDYAPDRLRTAMAHGHYYLQYHLYTLALHRYLERRLPGYAYDAHFGGVLYLFVRGMAPKRGPETGVFFEKPPLGRIEALSRLLDGKHAEVAA